MAQPAAAQQLTAEDLFVISSSSDDLQELDRGVLVCMPPAGALHGRLSAVIAHLLEEYVAPLRVGVVCGTDTGFILARNPDIVRAPDVSFVCRDRVPASGLPEFYWPFAPDLAVEVLSPSDRVNALDDKILQYFGAGTRLVWVVHPRPRTVHVYRAPTHVQVVSGDDDLTGGDVLPGFRCPVHRCFD
jgi:Uma2 family endonuclease